MEIENITVMATGYGIKDTQQLKTVSECLACKSEIYENELVLKSDGDLFCDESCLKDHLLDVADFEEVEVKAVGKT